MRITAVSDLHGHLPLLPGGELLVIAGDICPVTNHNPMFQRTWLDKIFRRWLLTNQEAYGEIVAVAGNHDFVFERGLAPSNLPWIYLEDEGVTIDGLEIWGSPWQPPFFDWAFNLPEDELAERFALIPETTELLLVHGPPRGIGDMTKRGEEVGSRALAATLERVKPGLVVCGHIHEAYGLYNCSPLGLPETQLINASMMTLEYEPLNAPVHLEL